MDFKKVYYRAHAVQDGTIYFVVPTRKPRKTRLHGKPEIDEDGVYSWFLEKPEDEERSHFTDWAKGVWQTCVAMTLNIKRTIRQQVEPKLDAQQHKIDAMSEQLKRIEEKLDQLTGSNN